MNSILIAFGILIGLIIIYAAAIAFYPGFTVPKQELTPLGTRRVLPPDNSRRDVSFDVAGTTIRAWLYLPRDLSAPAPAIVMGHGLGGTKAAGLERYARRFRDAGWAVLAFDYRYFGESDGEPRQLIRISDQLDDWRAAVNHVRGLPEIDPERIALWGTSFSGGHVLVLAAEDPSVACIVAQCPGLDGRAVAEAAFERLGLLPALRLIMHGQRDVFRSWLCLSPHKIPLAAKSDRVALMTTPGAFEGYSRMAPEGFVNEACARIILRADKYRPVEYASKIRCPVLLQVCDHDRLLPVKSAREAEKALGSLARVRHYPLDHFDIYEGAEFEKSVSDQISFFKENL
jgi:uncharacterized protein